MSEERSGPKADELVASIEQLSSQIVASSPIYGFVLQEVQIEQASSGGVTALLPLTDRHSNSKAILHGSVTATLVDWIGGLVIAAASSSPLQAKRGVSLDIHISYIGAAKAGQDLRIEGRADKVGRSIAFIAVRLTAYDKGTNANGRLVATATHNKFIA
ncbi:HGG motif-containing thioesterase [Ceraceosorus bombacis]|uniref:HGG motif-containing thioesterase n=1 Tax=Ceraceosorus bombacis TaxID=401625 RepID=A0A0P1BBN6_9BASI|nr:HGG motif-containing thioesterase [Ceraceosorus bombacis]